jgi:hypothetical protein
MQFDFGTIDPFIVDGQTLASYLNQWRDALHSLHRGANRPPYVVPGMIWINDSGGAANWLLELYLSPTIGDVVLASFNTTTGAVVLTPGIVGAFLPLAGGTINGDLIVNGWLRSQTAISAEGNNPLIYWNKAGNAADQKKWRSYLAADGTLKIGAVNDAETVETLISFFRNGLMQAGASPPAADNSAYLATTAWVRALLAAGVTYPVIKSSAASTPTLFQDSGGVEVGKLCRAWGTWDGDAVIDMAFNVSSITKISAGQYYMNFTQPAPGARYPTLGNANLGPGGTSATQSVDTGKCYVATANTVTQAFQDANWYSVACFW